jgi:cytochrome P450
MRRIDAVYARLRKETPLAQVQAEGYRPFWVVTRHADILEIERRSEDFINSGLPSALMNNEALTQGSSRAVARTLVSMDGAEHRAFRQLTQAWFMPRKLRNLEARIRGLARRSIESMAAHDGKCDFVSDVALMYPLRVIMEILGVPEPDEALMLKLTQEMFSSQDKEFARNDEGINKADSSAGIRAVINDFVAYFGAMIEDRRKNPKDDIVSVVANGLIDGRPIGLAEAMGYYVITATAGHDTTSNTLATGLWILAERPELLKEIKATPALIPALVEESIRWASPVRHFMRTASRDMEFAGEKITKGDWLMLCYLSGNRDESNFKNAFEFDIKRPQNQHVAFGSGVHMCLGQHLARMELRIFWEEFLTRLESVELAGTPALTAAIFVSGPKSLPVRYQLK